MINYDVCPEDALYRPYTSYIWFMVVAGTIHFVEIMSFYVTYDYLILIKWPVILLALEE